MLRISLLLLLLSTVLVVSMNSTTNVSPMKTRSDTSFLVKQTPPESFWISENVVEVWSSQSNSLEDIITNIYKDKVEQILLSHKSEKEKYINTSLSETSAAVFTTNYLKRKELVEKELAALEIVFYEWESELIRNNLSTERVKEYRNVVGKF
ncbi:hypothetical protein [Bacillus alkalisoli]|uniref:hypothetical protein n=1 Tax=Bacillus alkalisoli TaxID=2011008 RepID=UPI000C23A7F3|nr:hypothetical protein [Bacillus alkalisoli]